MADNKKYVDYNGLVELFKVVHTNYVTKEDLIEDENVIAHAFNTFVDVMGRIKTDTGEISYVPSSNDIIKNAKSLTDADDIMAKKIEEIYNKVNNTNGVTGLGDDEIDVIFQTYFIK